MDAKFVDLKVNRALLDPHFDGYKLSLDHIACYQHALESDIAVTTLNNEQYSYQHVKAYGLHNHLFPDEFNPKTVYTVDARRKIIRLHFAPDSTTPESSCVFSMPNANVSSENADRLNTTISFTSNEWVVLADGASCYHIIHTGNRNENHDWKAKFTSTLPMTCDPFTVVHSTHRDVDSATVIDAVFLVVSKRKDEPAKVTDNKEADETDSDNQEEGTTSAPTAPSTSSVFVTSLQWLTFTTANADEWAVSRTRRLEGASSPDYVAIQKDGKAIFVTSEKPFKFVEDSEKPIEVEKKEDWMVVQPDTVTDTSPVPLYTWSQTMEDLSLQFTLPVSATKADVQLQLTPDKLKLSVKNGPTLITGHFHAPIDPEASTWTIEGNRRLNLELAKREETLWPIVVLGDTRGEMTLDPKQVAEIHERLQHLTSDQWNPDPSVDQPPAYNTQQLEDCDIFPDDNATCCLIDGDTHQIKHQASLSGHQWLFNVHCASHLPAVCMRHDVDGLLWQTSNNSNDFLEHVATFNALGYVAASKRDRKFATCSADWSYAVLVDCVKHVYLYRQPEQTSTPLRNRKTGRQVATVAKQQLISLDSADQILGVYAGNQLLLVLTSRVLYALKIKED